MSEKFPISIECWSLMVFGCERTYTFKPRLFYSLILHCCSVFRDLHFYCTDIVSLCSDCVVYRMYA